MATKLTSLLFLLIIAAACQKENEPQDRPCEPNALQNHTFDTILPSDYIMAYPGSWWEFSDGSVESCSSSDPVSITEVVPSAPCLIILEDMHVLPLTSFLGYISNDSQVISDPTYQKSTTYRPLISETAGELYRKVLTGGSSESTTTIIITSLGHLDSLALGGVVYYDVISTRYTTSVYYEHTFGGPSWTDDYFFSKNIGLVGKHAWDFGSPTDTLHMTNHHIEPH
jgi:hypothetical protein